MVKLNAEEYTTQCLTHESEIKMFDEKLIIFTETNEILEKKYKGTMLELEQTKEKTTTVFKKFTKFENNSNCFDGFVAESKTNSDDRTGIGFCPKLKTQTKHVEPIKFVSGGKRPIETCPDFHSLKTEFDHQNTNTGDASCSKHESLPKGKYVCPLLGKVNLLSNLCYLGIKFSLKISQNLCLETFLRKTQH